MKFGPLMMDLPILDNPGVIAAHNVYPLYGSYAPVPSLNDFTSSLPAPCFGAFSIQSGDTTLTIAGTATALYLLNQALQWVEVGSGYLVDPNIGWSFTQFGTKILAVNGSVLNGILSCNLSGGSFVEIANSPISDTITVVQDQVLVSRGNVLKCSAFADETGWTLGVDGANEYVFRTGGNIVALTGGEYGVAFQDSSIRRISPVGLPIVHQIDEIDTDHGCVARNSVIKHRSTIVYLARDGFYEFTGQQSIPLGYQAVDIDFFSRVDMSFLRNMSGVVDPVKKLFLWVFPTQGSNGICARQMVFNWIERRWSTTDIECTRVFPLYSPGYTVEDIDRNYENIDAVPISLDSPDWLGGTLTLAYVKPNGAVASATGPSRAATIATGEGELYNRREVHLSGLVPIVDGAPATITVGTRNTLSEIPRFTNAGPVSKDGECSVRVTGRYFRAVLEIAAGLDWKFAIGLDYKSEQENNAVTLRGSKR